MKQKKFWTCFSLLPSEEARVAAIFRMMDQLTTYQGAKRIKTRSENVIKKLERKGRVKPSELEKWKAAGFKLTTGPDEPANNRLDPTPDLVVPEPSNKPDEYADWGFDENRPPTNIMEFMRKRQECIDRNRHVGHLSPSAMDISGVLVYDYNPPPMDLPLVALDCEMVTKPGQNGNENVAATVSIVDQDGKILMRNKMVKHLPGTFLTNNPTTGFKAKS